MTLPPNPQLLLKPLRLRPRSLVFKLRREDVVVVVVIRLPASSMLDVLVVVVVVAVGVTIYSILTDHQLMLLGAGMSLREGLQSAETIVNLRIQQVLPWSLLPQPALPKSPRTVVKLLL